MEITLDQDFRGGNLGTYRVDGSTVFVENDLRGCAGDWFYWAFRVRGAAGKTLRFDFGEKKRVGYWGAAVSRDLRQWFWSGNAEHLTAFTYTFGEEENEVYFCHDLYYSPERFSDFSKRQALQMETFCRTEKGRDLPAVRLGSGKRYIFLASRHHCCESTGTYLLEGALEALNGHLPDPYTVLVLPFVDYDGVMEGDQGKNRPPHDHNRDYIGQPIYSVCREIMRFADSHTVCAAIDLHSPHHCALTSAGPGPYCDHVFMLRKNPVLRPSQMLFSEYLIRESQSHPEALQYTGTYDFEYNTLWNAANLPTFSAYFSNRPETRLAFCLETTYYGTADNQVTQESLTALGRCLGRSLLLWIAHSL